MPTIINLKCFLQNINLTKKMIEIECLGADTELSPEVISFLGAALATDTDVEPVELDEYELAMAG